MREKNKCQIGFPYLLLDKFDLCHLLASKDPQKKYASINPKRQQMVVQHVIMFHNNMLHAYSKQENMR